VEQGILSYDDLSVMEIDDLVNTIEGLSEEQASDIVAKAEILAEEQAEEMPRRKGARIAANALEGTSAAEGGEARGARAARRTLADCCGGGRPPTGGGGPTGDEPIEGGLALESEEGPAEPDESGLETVEDAYDVRDLALADEAGPKDEDGREITHPPSDADQSETERIVTEAVELGATQQEIEAREAGTGRNVPAPPVPDPSSTGSSGVSFPDADR